jgi:hypothetical protein
MWRLENLYTYVTIDGVRIGSPEIRRYVGFATENVVK